MAKNEVTTATSHQVSIPAGGAAAMLRWYAQKLDDFETRNAALERRVQKMEDEAPIRQYQDHLLEKARRKRVVYLLGGKASAAYKDRALASSVFRAIMIEYRRKFGVPAYQETPKSQYDRAMHFYAGWEPDFELHEQIEKTNGGSRS